MDEQPFIRIDWIADNLDAIGLRLVEHLQMTVIAVVVGLVISFALALIIRAVPRLYGPVIGITGTMYSIPSLALFALLVPITGLSLVTAEIALVSYTLLILVRNIVAGLEGVPAEVTEAATAMGLSPSQRLLRVELPVALPVIVAGLRIATVTTIGLVTITTLIGAGGLGYLIVNSGINRFFPTSIYTGVVLAVALAIAADVLLLWIQRVLTPWARAREATG
ncbi:MAG TPA: ABC transporter permease [Candidatus Limnocylindria bacterium]|nr:ABC transporter permease [Candidatus Limnocylindria bacterium]